MRCRHCHSEMEQTDAVAEGAVRQVWYRCPVCSAIQTISHPYQAPLRRIGKLQRCSSEMRGLPERHRGLY
jgi:hypothetical protein